MSGTERRWSGCALLRPGVGAFAGQTGDNKPHRHWAHQISISLDGDVVVAVEGSHLRGPAVFVPAGVSHQLLQARVIAIYVDPTLAWFRVLATSSGAGDAAGVLAGNWIGDMKKEFLRSGSLSDCLDQLVDRFAASPESCSDARLELVLDALRSGARDPSIPMNRAFLANLAGVSGGRFSHWFSGQTGMPFRSYRKWLRLVHGLELVLAGDGLTDAAYHSGFTDQAYFTRTFVELFGIAPSQLLADVKQQAGKG